MPRYLVLPKIGMNMEEGTIVEWLVKPGDQVSKDQMIVRAETDKSVQDIFATDSGTILRILAQEGDTVKCQEPIAVLGEEGELLPEETADAPVREAPPAAQNRHQVHAAAAAPRMRPGQVRISPLAKKIAAENGLDPGEIPPSQAGKRITKDDVLRELARKTAPAPQDAGGRFVPYSAMRRATARHMTDSAAQKPRVSLSASVDCEGMIALRQRLLPKHKISYQEILAKACAYALRDFPEMNAVTVPGGVLVKDHIDIGIAVDTDRGLLVPVLRDVDRKGLFQLSDELGDLVERVRTGRQDAGDITGGSLTVTNLGMFGVEFFDPILNAPECFILGVGCMKKIPVVVDDSFAIRTNMQISLSFDHAAFDGAAAAKLLRAIREYLEHPETMLA